MTNKTTMPEPVARGIFYQSVMPQGWAYNKEAAQAIADENYPELKVEVKPLITTDQAEAYAAAKVREALEEAIDLCETDGALYTAFDMAEHIRALIPTTK